MKPHELQFRCPHCDEALKCDPAHAGRLLECSGCRRLVRIPPPAGEATAPEPVTCRDWDTCNWGG